MLLSFAACVPSPLQITACTSSFCFKLDAVSTPGIPEVERQRMEVRTVPQSHGRQNGMHVMCYHAGGFLGLSGADRQPDTARGLFMLI